MKWQTILEIVDINTGELLQKSAIERGEYIILKKSAPSYTITDYLEKSWHGKLNKKGLKKITWECIPNPQTKLL